MDLNNILEITDEEFQQLDKEEREFVIKIMKEYQEFGESKTLNDLYYCDYEEIPVDIITFIKHPRYLGRAWHTADGKCKLFPYWEKRLKELFPDNTHTSVNNAIFSGARGLGKSEVAITCALYMMYRLMCLRNPHQFLNLKPSETVAFAFMNITEILAMEIGVSKFQATVQLSPWFLEHGTLSGRQDIKWSPPPWINIIVGSQPRHTIGQAIYFAFFDEISFITNQDIEKQKEKAIDMIDTAIGGMKTRFTNKGQNPTLLVLASSKRSEKSFLETHTKKKLESEHENLLLVDEPVWNVRPPEEYSGRTFYVGQGNKFLASEVLPDNVSDFTEYINKGYKILKVPIEFKAAFLDDIDRALCDYAGISSSDITKYISGVRWMRVLNKEYSNPFTQEIIEVGNAPDDKVQYYDFFDLSKIDPKMKYRPLFVHLDMSTTGDRTGIDGVWIAGKKPPAEGEPPSKELYFKNAFSIAIKAPKGYQISYEKNRQFIYWLKEQGFNIRGVSSDTYQSTDTGQALIAKGYNYKAISVDRTDKIDATYICRPYHYFKNTIYEERLITYENELLTREVLDLERDTNGKINHPDGGKTGSKDLSDALCGAIWHAQEHAEEFAFDFGETLDVIADVNTEGSYVNDFQSELNREMAQSALNRLTKTSRQSVIDKHRLDIEVDNILSGGFSFDDDIII